MGLFNKIEHEKVSYENASRILKGLFNNMHLKYNNQDIWQNSARLLTLLEQREQGVDELLLRNQAILFANSVNCYFGVESLHFEGTLCHKGCIVCRFKIYNGDHIKVVQI